MIPILLKSFATALFIAAAVQCFTIGVLAPVLPRQVCRPAIEETREFAFEAVPALELNNADGAIVVNAGGNQIEVSAHIRVYCSSQHQELARSYVDALFRTDTDGHRVSIVTEPGFRPDELDLSVDYTFHVPPGTDFSVHGPNGNVRIAKGCGRAGISGNNRDIKIESPTGPVDVDITNGRIEVYDATTDARLRTVNGKIYVHMQGGRLDASTTNGNIVAALLTPEVTVCELKSMNGGITLVLPENFSAQVEAVTGRGVVKSDFAVKPLLGHQRQRQMRGIIGSGQTRLALNSLNGNIWLAKE